MPQSFLRRKHSSLRHGRLWLPFCGDLMALISTLQVYKWAIELSQTANPCFQASQTTKLSDAASRPPVAGSCHQPSPFIPCRVLSA